MPIQNFNEDTFVAFTDISGFKEMMKDEKRAMRAIDDLYRTGYYLLQNNQYINGFFISDSGILFVKNTNGSKEDQIVSLLKVLENINRELLKNDFMLTTSIAYGPFSYHQRIESPSIRKTPIYGDAYVKAFMDNENGKPKIQPGECRIISQTIEGMDLNLENNHSNHNTLKKVKKKGSHYYFYWNVNNFDDIDNFNKDYNDAYKLKYQGMLDSLKRYCK